PACLQPGLASGHALPLSPPPGRAAAAAQRNAGLGEDAMDEPVGPASGSGKRSDALPRAVPLLQVRGQLRAIGTGHPGALLQGLCHASLAENLRAAARCRLLPRCRCCAAYPAMITQEVVARLPTRQQKIRTIPSIACA